MTGIAGNGGEPPSQSEDRDIARAVAPPVIECKGLHKHFSFGGGIIASVMGRPERTLRAVNGVDLVVRKREVLGLVGESGSGKSTLAMTLLRLYDPTAGTIRFQGRDITEVRGSELKTYRRASQMIFQDPYGSLNPRLTVAQVVEEPLRIHGITDERERATMAFTALRRVSLPPEDFLHRYPYELSGGQRQRIAIARAIVLGPEFIVADEPVSMLDVSIQASVLGLLSKLSRDLGIAIIYVSHDIATVRYIADRVAVMYGGSFVEYGDTRKVVNHPTHPYTQGLLAAVPSVDPTADRKRVDIQAWKSGDRWLPTGDHKSDCGRTEPHWEEIESDHHSACPFHPASHPAASTQVTST